MPTAIITSWLSVVATITNDGYPLRPLKTGHLA